MIQRTAPLHSHHSSTLLVSLLYEASLHLFFLFFFLNETAPTEISPLPLHDALPILAARRQPAVEPFEGPPAPAVVVRRAEDQPPTRLEHAFELAEDALVRRDVFDHFRADHAVKGRSEEHTSELQSPCNLVCRLLLEK